MACFGCFYDISKKIKKISKNRLQSILCGCILISEVEGSRQRNDNNNAQTKYTHGALERGSQKVKWRVTEEVEKRSLWGLPENSNIIKVMEGKSNDNHN